MRELRGWKKVCVYEFVAGRSRIKMMWGSWKEPHWNGERRECKRVQICILRQLTWSRWHLNGINPTLSTQHRIRLSGTEGEWTGDLSGEEKEVQGGKRGSHGEERRASIEFVYILNLLVLVWLWRYTRSMWSQLLSIPHIVCICM